MPHKDLFRTPRPKHVPRFEVHLSMSAEVIDDRVAKLTEEAMRQLQAQGAAYVQVAVEQQMLDRLTKHMPANLAQFAVSALLDELSHMHLRLGQPQVELLETKDADQEPLLLEDDSHD